MARSAAAVVAAIALMAALCAEGTTLGCVDLLTDLCPCSQYVAGRLSEPGAECCAAARTVKNSITDAVTKLAACTCINNVLSVVVGVDVTLINNIPKLCDIDPNFSLSGFCIGI